MPEFFNLPFTTLFNSGGGLLELAELCLVELEFEVILLWMMIIGEIKMIVSISKS